LSGLVTVIGGSGFVGTNFCQLLSDKQIAFEIVDLKVSVRFPEKTKIGDVRDIASLRSAVSGDLVVNLAAVHRDDVTDKSDYQRTNVLGAENVAQVCREKGIKKIVFTSSVAVYGFAEPGTDEGGAINPFNEYGRTKFAAEEVFRRWQSETGHSLQIIRPTVIFGEGNRGNVYNLLQQIASGNFVMIGSGQNKKSMAYVGNVVGFLEACVNETSSYGVYNYVDTPNLTMAQLVSEVRHSLGRGNGTGLRLPYFFGLLVGYLGDAFTSLTGKKLPVSSIRVKKFCSSSEFNCGARPQGFVAKHRLEDAISRTIDAEFLHPDPNREIFFTE
jgi:nucleoside-diphosphate-sugar epimerase